ncbi:MAG: Na+/H+ antiporter subunit C [Halorhodospira sp.]
MEPLMAVLVGITFAAALYMMLRRSIVKLIIGLILLSNAANLLFFTAGGLTRGAPPLIPEGAEGPVGVVADPLPQALILTAIVISFGVLAFALVLIRKAYQVVQADDLDQMKGTDT